MTSESWRSASKTKSHLVHKKVHNFYSTPCNKISFQNKILHFQWIRINLVVYSLKMTSELLKSASKALRSTLLASKKLSFLIKQKLILSRKKFTIFSQHYTTNNHSSSKETISAQTDCFMKLPKQNFFAPSVLTLMEDSPLKAFLLLRPLKAFLLIVGL